MCRTMLASLIAAPFIFAACAWFTRAGLPRILAALAGGLAFAVGNVGWDFLGRWQSWWWYPREGGRAYLPLFWYGAVGLSAAGVSLIGWRVHRRWGRRGLAIFVVLFSMNGTLRDWRVSRTDPEMIRFGTGARPWVADFLAWLTLMAAAMGTQTWLRGDPRRDILVRQQRASG